MSNYSELLSGPMLYIAQLGDTDAEAALAYCWLNACKWHWSEQVPTAGTDGVRLLMNPKFVEGLTKKQRVFLLMHEAYHAMRQHVAQWSELTSVNKMRANVAMDLLINEDLVAKLTESFTIPETVRNQPKLWRDPSDQHVFDRNQHDWYWVYARLSDNPNGGGGNGIGDGSDLIEGEGECSPAEAGRVFERAVSAAKSMRTDKWGSVPGWLEREFAAIGAPRKDWRAELWDVQQSCVPIDYSYKKLKRPYAFFGAAVPTLTEPGVGEIVVFVDTSGSITEEMLAQPAAECSAIWRTLRPEKIHVVYVDAAVAGVDVFEPDDEIKFRPRGGGGTDFRPAFDWIEEQGIEPACVLYFTDGYGCFPSDEPDYPVIWCRLDKNCLDEKEFPFGRVITIED